MQRYDKNLKPAQNGSEKPRAHSTPMLDSAMRKSRVFRAALGEAKRRWEVVSIAVTYTVGALILVFDSIYTMLQNNVLGVIGTFLATSLSSVVGLLRELESVL